ncbi:MAG: HisA/HisF-related TIM barrel protein [Methanobacteriota archaeon]
MDKIPAISVMRGGAVFRKGDEYEYAGRPSEMVEKLGKRFERILLVDIDALEGREPQFSLFQELSEGDAELWLDTGAQVAGDLVHPFVTGASAVVVGTKSLRTLDAFQLMFKVSGDVVPSVELNGGELVWCKGEPPSAEELLKHLKELGFSKIIVADLGRSPGTPLDERPIMAAVALGFDVYAAGGVTSADVAALESMGAKGAILDLRSVLSEGD